MAVQGDHANLFLQPENITERTHRLSDASEYTLPELTFPSVLDVDTIIRDHGIEAYIDDSDVSSLCEEDLEDVSIHDQESVTDCVDHNRQRQEEEPEQDSDTISPLPIHSLASVQEQISPPARQKTFQSRRSLSLRHSSSRLDRRNTTKSLTDRDPNLVTWESPSDPANPHNWPRHRKWTSTILIAAFAFIAPMASTMVAPALDTIADEFNIQSKAEEFLVMSIFLLAFAIGPFLWGPLSEVFGRVKVIQTANLIFLLFNTVCGWAKTKEQMMAFRFLSGIGGSAPQAIGGGILSDCFRAGERGTATAIYSLMPFLSPAVAPIMGAYLTQYTTWRWVFWSTSIFDLVVQVACLILLKETFAPTILAQKAAKLKKVTGNTQLHTKWQGPDHSLKKLLVKSLVRPIIMLGTQPALQAMAFYRAYQYGLMYLVFATFPMVWEEAYNQDLGRASLNYLSLGVGFMTGLQFSKGLQDKIYTWCKDHQINPSAPVFSRATWDHIRRIHRHPDINDTNALLPMTETGRQKPAEDLEAFRIARKPVPAPVQRTPMAGTLHRSKTSKSMSAEDPTKGLPEYRLPLLLPFSLFIPIGLFMYGWSAHARVHWIVPNIGCAIFAMGLIVCFNCAQAYVVDTYTTYAASATGAAAFVRTMAGFSFPLFAPRMYDVFGVGWGNSLLGFISLTIGLVAPVVLWRYGGWLRSKSTYCTG